MQGGLKQQIAKAADILRSLANPLARKMMAAVPKAHDVTERYWQDPDFLGWLSQHGIRASGVPEFKDGGAGRAYFVGNFVVKFTGNPIEARVAKMVAGRNDLPAPVIDVKDLGNLFAILEHKVKMGGEVDKRIRDAADWLTLVVDDNPDMTGFPSDPGEQEALIVQTLQDNDGPLELKPYMMMVMAALSSLYQGTGFKHDDAGPSNIGMYQDRIVFPDLGPNQTADFSVDRANQQIDANRRALGLDQPSPTPAKKRRTVRPASRSSR